MTTYHIDPVNGSDNNSGSSWGSAWRSLRALRVQSITPVPGDLFKYAKSQRVTNASFTLDSSTNQPEFGLRGVITLSTLSYEVGYGASFFRLWNNTGPQRRCLHVYWSLPGGTMEYNKPTLGYRDLDIDGELTAVANNGEFNVPNTTLVYMSLSSISASDLSLMTSATFFVRFPEPYDGPGTKDIPAGSLIFSLYTSSDVLVCDLPVMQIVRNDANWTAVTIQAPAGGFPATATSRLALRRSGQALDRDSRRISIEVMGVDFWSSSAGPHIGATAIILNRNATLSSSYQQTHEVAGSVEQRVCVEFMTSDMQYADGCSTLIATGVNRITRNTDNVLGGVLSQDLYLTGAHALSPPGSMGEFDLNGSAGGTSANPITISGGWDMSTDTVDGVTVFGAGHTPKYPSAYSLFDLAWADNVVISDICAVGSYQSLFTRALNVTVDRGHLPFGVTTKPFGETSDNTNVTLRRMHLAPYVLDTIGRMGKLTMIDTFYTSPPNSKRKFAIELRGGFHMDASHFGGPVRYNGDIETVAGSKRLDIWGDAILENMTLLAPPTCVGRKFGHSLVIRNPTPLSYYNNTNAKLVQTAPESRWDVIDYQGSYANYSLWNYSNRVLVVSADATIYLPWAYLISEEMSASGGTKTLPTTMRGSRSNGTFSDGMFAFSDNVSTGLDHTQTYIRKRNADPDASWAPAVLGYSGDVLVPRINSVRAYSYVYEDYYEPLTTSNATEADAVPIGRSWIMRRLPPVKYRTDATFFLALGREIAYGSACLKAVYLPRAGRWRAEVGFNIDFVFPPRMASTGNRTGRSIRYNAHDSEQERGSIEIDGEAVVNGGPVPMLALHPASMPSGVATPYDAWQTTVIDFETTGPCLAHVLVYPKVLRTSTKGASQFDGIIFDKVTIYERT